MAATSAQPNASLARPTFQLGVAELAPHADERNHGSGSTLRPWRSFINSQSGHSSPASGPVPHCASGFDPRNAPGFRSSTSR